ncbi:AfsR/SARP family transcriptional regulator [Desulfonatronum parangueonense]
MRKVPLNRLLKPFQVCYRHGLWDQYARLVEDYGAVWLLDLHLHRLAMHVMPLLHVNKGFVGTARVRFLLDVVQGAADQEKLSAYHRKFHEAGDALYATAAIDMGVSQIWSCGNSLQRLENWKRLADKTLEFAEISYPAAAGLWLQKAFIALLGEGDFESALHCAKFAKNQAAHGGSSSLMLRTAWISGMPLTFTGDFGALRILVQDALPLCATDDASFGAVSQLKTLAGLLNYFEGRCFEAEEIFREILAHPMAEHLPVSARLLISGPLLMTVSGLGKKDEVDELAHELRQQAIAQHNYYFCSCAHYCLGVSELALGKPYDALLHGKEGMEQGTLSDGPLPASQCALVAAQALVDLERMDEAESFLLHWITHWRETGFQYFAACGAMEMARLRLCKGDLERAGEFHDLGMSLTTNGRNLRVVNRPPEFMQNLRKELQPRESSSCSWGDANHVVVRVQTLGDFVMTVGDHVLYDRKWRGERTKLLLKALIVHGGTKVSMEVLVDLLWPDKDGDMAANNLKVAISRLRKLVNKVAEDQVNWLIVTDSRVSLVKRLCHVDCLSFREMLQAALHAECDVDDLAGILDKYTGDFIPADATGQWIDEYRQRLRKEYVRGVVFLAQRCLRVGESEKALEYLLRVQDMSMINEQIFALLMQTYLNMGYPSDALAVFRQARFRLKKDYDVLPGTTLLSLARQAREAV